MHGWMNRHITSLQHLQSVGGKDSEGDEDSVLREHAGISIVSCSSAVILILVASSPFVHVHVSATFSRTWTGWPMTYSCRSSTGDCDSIKDACSIPSGNAARLSTCA